MINKILNNKFYKGTLILLIGGLFTKIVGFVLKIIITRKIGTSGVSVLSMINPTLSLITVLSIFSFPTTISSLISKNKYNSKSIIISSFKISIVLNLFLMIITILLSKFISGELLKNSELYLPIIFVALTIPFVSSSSIIKGYFLGKQNNYPYMLSNFIEQITRIVIILVFIDKVLVFGIIKTICFILLVNIIGEIVSILVMIYYFPNKEVHISDFKTKLGIVKDISRISIQATLSRLVGSISYFLEPIILINVLTFMNVSKNYITYEYGIINGYALTLLLMPQFFIQNVSSSLIPELSKHYSNKNFKMCISRIKQIVSFSLFIGIISTLAIVVFKNALLNILFSTTEGIEYINILAPFIILYYIESPLACSLQALDKTKNSLFIIIVNSIIKLLSIIILSLLGLKIYSLILSIIINLILSCYMYYKCIYKTLHL